MLSISQKKHVLRTRELFLKDFNEYPTDCFQSCGRLEIIGNHVDYNGGSVINSSAGNLNIFTSVRKCDGAITIKSEGYPDLIVSLDDLSYKEEEKETSVALVKGILTRFRALGYKIGGFNAEMVSTIYKGGGVSSSASYCVMVCKILSYYYNDDALDVITMAKISRWSENTFFGKGSGLQDEIGCCAKGFAITDYRDQENPVVTQFPVDLGDYKILLLDTKTDHSESQGGFQQLVSDMHEIAEYFHVDYLIEIPMEAFMKEYELPEHASARNWNRAYHFKTEVERVERAYQALRRSDIEAFLVEFNASGLSSEYKLKSIVAEGHSSNNLSKALHLGRSALRHGAIRVHGGGFGGTCMIFVRKDEEEEFIQKMSAEFPRDQFISVEPSDDPLRRIPESEYLI